MYYDILARIKNGFQAKKESVFAPYSNFDFAVAKVLEANGFLKSVEKKPFGKKNNIEMRLKYAGGNPAMTDFKLLSKPSRRMYEGYQELRPVKQGYGISVLSTSAGVMSNKEARKKKVGGEYLFEIW